MSRLTLASLGALGLVAAAIGFGCGDDEVPAPSTPAKEVPDAAVEVEDGSSNPDSGGDAAAGPLGPGPSFNGLVVTSVHVGSSWYVGGLFTLAGMKKAPGILALDANDAPPTACDLGNGFNGVTSSVVAVGNAIYVGGKFTTYNGMPAGSLAKIDATTCALDAAFSADLSSLANPAQPNGPKVAGTVHTLAIAGNALFVGGDLLAARGAAISHIAKLDLTTGAVVSGFNAVGAGFDRPVSRIVGSDAAIYVGGQFDRYRGEVAWHLVKLDPVSGVRDESFSPVLPSFAGLALTNDALYASSDNKVLKLDPATGSGIDGFTPPSIDGAVFTLLATDTALFVGGAFSGYSWGADDGPSVGVAKFDLATGQPIAGFGKIGVAIRSTGPGVTSFAQQGNTLYVGGAFESADGSIRNFAKVDATTGAFQSGLKPAGSGVGGFPKMVAGITPIGQTIWVTGSFDGYGGHQVNNIAKLDDETFAIDTTFSPPAANGFDNAVSALLSANNALYVGGYFSSYRGVTDSACGVAKLDLTTGALDTTFSPPTPNDKACGEVNGFVESDRGVSTLAASGDALFIGGGFTTYRSKSHAGLVKVSQTSGAIDTAFSGDDVGAGFEVDQIPLALAANATSLFVGGSFESYKSPTNVNSAGGPLLKLDLATGELDGAFANPEFGTGVTALAISGNAVYVGGFVQSGDGTRGITKVDPATGALDTTFSPPGMTGINPSTGTSPSAVLTLTTSDSSLYIGGTFQKYRGAAAVGLAKVDLVTGVLDGNFGPPSATRTTDFIYTVAAGGSNLFVGGAFGVYSPAQWTSRAVVLDLATGAHVGAK